jgi:hypothetical protein
MDIVAIVCVREDHQYLENCLSHLISNGVNYALIDNGIGDEGRAILAKPWIRRHLVSYAELPYRDRFELKAQLDKKEEMVDAIKTDWCIHLDVDEIMHSYRESETLEQGITRLDAAGWTVINFNEFVFLPVLHDYEMGIEGFQPMRHYYFFEPTRPRLMRARKKSTGLSTVPRDGNMGAGGHVLFGDGLKLAPENFALRHYIVRNQEHAFEKYTSRRFSDAEVQCGWHFNRIGNDRAAYTLPPTHRLLALEDPRSRAFDRSKRETTHFWEWNNA